MSHVSDYQKDILARLNQSVPFTVEAAEVRGQWHSFTPILVFSGLRITLPHNADKPIEVGEGRVALDVLETLQTRTLQMARLSIAGLNLQGELTAQGQLSIAGFQGGGGDRLRDWFEGFLLNLEHLTLSNNQLQLTLPGGEKRDLDLNLQVIREGSYRRVEGELLSTAGTRIYALAEGLGNPLQKERFSGDLYLDIDLPDVAAVGSMLPDGGPVIWGDGALDLQLWLGWDRGLPSVDASLRGRDLVLRAKDESWRVPLDYLALEGSLIERDSSYTVMASNLEVQSSGAQLLIPRVQFDTRGASLRVRAEHVPVAPLNDILVGLDVTPAKLAEVFRIMSPRGELTALQFDTADIASLGKDWQLEANFEQLALESWSGAPGVSAARGFAKLSTGGGSIVLDSQQFSMSFPSVYREPLYFDDFNGTVYVGWDKDAVILSSDLITARGVEGTANALFGLTIPLQASAVGVEMDLLVGLEDTYPIHRSKYLPYILNDGLLNWLGSSIGEGHIEEGAFLWRGSLRKQASAARTVQLFFTVDSTRLTYHPDWPAVFDLEGTVLINDANVSVWSESARLFDSDIRRLSVETWVNSDAEVVLAVQGKLYGTAADGLAVVNDSALTEIVGQTFSRWKLDGDLETELQLEINLGDKTVAPKIDVALQLQDVKASIEPGGLSLEGVTGSVNYNASRGFSSEQLTGTMWGKPLVAELKQLEKVLVDKGLGSEEPVWASPVEVQVESDLAMADIRSWLNLEQLAFAEGKSAVDLSINITPGQLPVLRLESNLLGTSLDLPSPWGKRAEQARDFSVRVPLGAEAINLGIELEPGFRMSLEVAENTFVAGAIGFARAPAPLQAGMLRITGHAPVVDEALWIDFVDQYFSTSPELDESGLSVSIEELQADTLVLWGQDLHDVVFSLQIDATQWQLEAEAPWMRGMARISEETAQSYVALEYLDLAGFDQLSIPAGSSGQTPDLPDFRVSIEELLNGDKMLGDLHFNLHSADNTLTAENITGELAGLTLNDSAPGELVWSQGSESKTDLNLQFSFRDLGASLEQLDYENIVETESGSLTLALNWPGGPQDFSLLEGQGSLLLGIDAGRFLDAPAGATGALRVVNILNLAEIVGQLSLSHMFESGIPFHAVDGEIFLHSGTLEVASMDVRGASSGFQFSGVSNMEKKTLDGELVATLPVANNLTWVAALAAGLPVAAGVFVVSKVFEKQVNSLSSAVYEISGTWDDPQIKLDRIFDTAQKKNRSKTAAAPLAADDSPVIQSSTDDS